MLGNDRCQIDAGCNSYRSENNRVARPHFVVHMKILLVSWYFPPANTIAALRIGKLAKYLLNQGHDVRVVAGKGLPYLQSLPLDIPAENVAYARWVDVNAGPRWLSARGKKFIRRDHQPVEAVTGQETLSKSTQNGEQPLRLLTRLSRLYQNVFNWPDSRIGWLPFALCAGWRLLGRWRPQVIFASGPPFTVLLVGYWLSVLYRIPLIVEFRDRWSDDPYYPPPKWRRRFDKFAEGVIVRRAIAISTVSEPWATTYRRRYGKPVAVVYNGYDEELEGLSSSPGYLDKGILRIVYTGGIYPGRRDPSPLFAAIRELGDDRHKIRVEFFATDPNLVHPLAARHGVGECIIVHPALDHDRIIDEQRRADILLLMQWDDPKEQGNVPGKFFEYLGALRPILVLGLEDGVPASFVRNLDAGVFCADADAIAQILRTWLEVKQNTGVIPSVPEVSRRGFSRAQQYAKLSKLIENVVGSD